MSKHHNCSRCGATKRYKWRRCQHCDLIDRKYSRNVDRDRVHALKARIAGMREARRANDKLIAMEAYYKETLAVCRYNERKIREKWEIFQRELNRLLANWVGWPPDTHRVRNLPPMWRIAYRERMPTMGYSFDSDTALSIELRTEDLYPIEAIVRRDIHKWGMHIELRDGKDRCAYYLDDWSPLDGHAREQAIAQLIHELSERRRGR